MATTRRAQPPARVGAAIALALSLPLPLPSTSLPDAAGAAAFTPAVVSVDGGASTPPHSPPAIPPHRPPRSQHPSRLLDRVADPPPVDPMVAARATHAARPTASGTPDPARTVAARPPMYVSR